VIAIFPPARDVQEKIELGRGRAVVQAGHGAVQRGS
jgi:hypothetical protein